MDVLITSAYADPQPISAFRTVAGSDRFGIHRVMDDPERAEIVLFVENSHYGDDQFFLALRRHPWVRRYPEKCFMYNEHDRPYCPLPGLYCSMPRPYFDRTRQRACDYLYTHNLYVEETASIVRDPDLLFSFVGRRNARVRDRILELRHREAHIRDTTHFDAYLQEQNHGTDAVSYAEVMARSRFVLCPRGVGTGSQRLFETMRAGRVPVILSDDWVEPDGPRWAEFSLRIRESEVESVPALLEAHDVRWREMAHAARAGWEEWFAPDVKFHRTVEGCLDILRTRRVPEAVVQRIPRPFPLYVKNRTRAVARQALLAVGRAR
jgi:hypothetical protein